MNKLVIGIIVVIFVVAAILGIFLIINHQRNNGVVENNDKVEDNAQNQVSNSLSNHSTEDNAKSVVLYFSATGTTKQVAEYIKEETNSNIIEIIPKEKYTENDLNYNTECRANREQNDSNSRPEIENDIDVSNYDVIYLGYPIWWGDVPKIILTLLEKKDFSGKTVIPFCTSGGSSITKSVDTLKSYKNINWNDGRAFNRSTSKSDIQSWIDELLID